MEFARDSYGVYPLFSGNGILERPVKDFRDYTQAMIFSHFKDDAGRTYLMVTNNSCTENIHPTIYLKGEERRVFLYYYGNVERELQKGEKLGDNGRFESKSGLTQIPMWLAPGQAFLIRWE